MARHFQLFSAPDGSEPLDLNVVDEQICAEMGVPVHPEKYCLGWFDSIGFLIALGHPLGSTSLRDELRVWEKSVPDIFRVLRFMERTYISHAWAR